MTLIIKMLLGKFSVSTITVLHDSDDWNSILFHCLTLTSLLVSSFSRQDLANLKRLFVTLNVGRRGTESLRGYDTVKQFGLLLSIKRGNSVQQSPVKVEMAFGEEGRG